METDLLKMGARLFAGRLAVLIERALRDKGIPSSDVLWLARYLAHYGHVESLKGFSLSNAISWLRAALNHDGSDALFIKTLQETPRCGCQDAVYEDAEAITSARWTIPEVTYALSGFVDELTNGTQWENMEICAEQTMKACGLKLRRAADASVANLCLGVGSCRGDQFDGPGGVLGWNYLPNNAGQNSRLTGKLDTGENWTQIMHQRVVRHESFGHGLGMSHSNVPGSVMNPFLQPLDDWQAEDIRQLQLRYGKPQAPQPPQPSPQPPATPPAAPNATCTFSCGDWRVSVVDGQLKVDGYSLVKVNR